MKAIILGIATVVGLTMTIDSTRAMPVASLDSVATDSSKVIQAHWRFQRHIHRGSRVIYLQPGTVQSGRSGATTGAPRSEKKMQKPGKQEHLGY